MDELEVRLGRPAYGGAKGGVACNPHALSRRELEAVSRRYLQEMIPFVSPQTDVMAPDMGTDEQVMAWFMDTFSMHQGHSVNEIVKGKPVALGGTEGRRHATGRGVAHLVGRACGLLGLNTHECTAVIQGFGNVGSVTAYTLARKHGGKIVGVSDHTAAIYDGQGPPLDAIETHVRENGVLAGFTRQMGIEPGDLLLQPCDILAPCAVERVIDEETLDC